MIDNVLNIAGGKNEWNKSKHKESNSHTSLLLVGIYNDTYNRNADFC